MDKIEPKFKVGEWVIFNGNHNSVYQVERIDNYRYHLRHYLGGSLSVHFDNELIRKWTIQDAKDGDVLATDSWLYIFKYTNNKALIQFHCTCPINGRPYKWCFSSDSDDSYLDIYVDANIHPATKEQRDLLFQKMYEAGYMWDSKSKQLLSLKAEPSGKQKPAEWSKEDERMYRGLHNLIYSTPYCDSRKEFSNWLNSLKDRAGCESNCTTTKEWSEEDKDYYDAIIAKLEVTQDDAGLTDNQMEFLKSLKQRIGG